MKIHTFRLKRDEVGIENKLENKYPLYAFTRDKKIAARFMRERDQKDFIYIQITKDKEEFDSWAAHNRAVQLDVYPIETYTHKNTNKIIKKVTFLWKNNSRIGAWMLFDGYFS